VHALSELYQQVSYFPAYELVIDELRDYRFYAEDLVHPTFQATRYVWEKFVEYCLHNEAKLLLPVLHDISLAFQHRPLHPGTTQHKAFLQQYAEKTQAVQLKYPLLNLESELQYFQSGAL
ncbi:MAG: GSCFA domain-containing protein, partial [Sediminibacterium sp.]|nr:GSCFA domain-containing protein [Sediminibacterium sp.]